VTRIGLEAGPLSQWLHADLTGSSVQDAQEARADGREKLLQSRLRDIEPSIRGILRGFGLKAGEISKGRFAPPSAPSSPPELNDPEPSPPASHMAHNAAAFRGS
jgi:hypothetical protein